MESETREAAEVKLAVSGATKKQLQWKDCLGWWSFSCWAAQSSSRMGKKQSDKMIFHSSRGRSGARWSFICLLSKRSSSHLALTLSPRIHYLIHLMSPCILLSQTSTLTSWFFSHECTCKPISSCKKNTQATPPTPAKPAKISQSFHQE